MRFGSRFAGEAAPGRGPRLGCAIRSIVTLCHLSTTSSGMAVIRGVGSGVVPVADKRLPSRPRYTAVESRYEPLGDQVKMRPPEALAVRGWPEPTARPMMAIQ
jgi:hypothetical protein